MRIEYSFIEKTVNGGDHMWEDSINIDLKEKECLDME